MSHKIIFVLLLAIAGTKVFSQDSLKTISPHVDSYAIMEIKSKGAFSSTLYITIYYDNGKVEDISDKLPILYQELSYKLPKPSSNNDTYSNNNSNSFDDIPFSQKLLLYIKYMAEKNYVLVTSTAQYQSYPKYIFRKKE